MVENSWPAIPMSRSTSSWSVTSPARREAFRRSMKSVGSASPESILHLFSRLLHVAQLLVVHAFGLEIAIAGDLPRRLLHLAPRDLGHVLQLIHPCHWRSSLLVPRLVPRHVAH